MWELPYIWWLEVGAAKLGVSIEVRAALLGVSKGGRAPHYWCWVEL